MQDCGVGMGVFRQIVLSTVLRDNQLLSCGLELFIVNTAYGGYTELQYNPEMQSLPQDTICMIDGPEGFVACGLQEFMAYIQGQDKWAFLKLSFFGCNTNQE